MEEQYNEMIGMMNKMEEELQTELNKQLLQLKKRKNPRIFSQNFIKKAKQK